MIIDARPTMDLVDEFRKNERKNIDKWNKEYPGLIILVLNKNSTIREVFEGYKNGFR